MDVPMEHLQRVPRPSPAASGQDRSPLRLMDRISRAKNRMRQSRSSGTVGGEGGNLLAYPANLIKLHKAQLASDRMSCHSAIANQVRLVFHTAAYWLMHRVRAAIPSAHPLARAEFATIRERLIKPLPPEPPYTLPHPRLSKPPSAP